jgi:hypothetical protein
MILPHISAKAEVAENLDGKEIKSRKVSSSRRVTNVKKQQLSLILFSNVLNSAVKLAQNLGI